MTGALSTLARYHFDKGYRQKLLFIRNEVEHGADVWQCFADAKVLSPAESDALRQSPTSQSQAWTLRQFAEMKEAATQNRIDQALVFARPIVVLLQAAFVLWIATGVLQILTQLTIGIS